jgi:uncharacterized protein YkwD
MRRTLTLFLSAILALGVLLDRPGLVRATASDDLYAAITTYRQGLGLAAIPLSPQLTAVAKAHVQDLMANFTTDPNYTGTDCVPHGWSSKGNWTGGCYKFADPNTFPIMWNKPKEIANYPGNGFEILFGSTGFQATAAAALQAWQADPPHNDVIVNQGIWKDLTWRAIGVWVEDGWASVWFGEQTDPNATQPTTTQTGQPAGNGDTGGAPVPPGNATAGGNTTTRAGTTTGNGTGGTTPPACVDAEELAFLKLINDYRAANGVGPLALSPTLSAAAKAHSQDMATKNYFDHTGLDGSTPQQRMTASGYTGANATGENIFAGDEHASGAFASWKNSPPHNANMLSPNFTAIGIGRAFDANSKFGWYWTTTFGDKVDAACGGPAATGQPAGNGTTGNGQTDQTGGTGGNVTTTGTGNVTTGTGNATVGADRDGDGLTDADETNAFGTNPDLFDTDGGGVGDGQEVTNGTNPLDPNDDNGGTGTDTGTQAGNATANSDRDGDGLLDDDETNFYGTNPDQFDTDGGGVGDGEEVFNGTNPLDASDDNGGNATAGTDSDGDGLLDDDETNFYGTDPNAFDTDGDGVGDGQEVFNGTDPLDPSSS